MVPLELRNITKIYKKGFRAVKVPAVTNLSFSVEPESITGFVGPNGAGKTTSIKMLLGLVKPTHGHCIIRGEDSCNPRARQRVAYASEQPYFYQHLTVRESLSFVYHLNRFPSHKLSSEIDRVLQSVELTGVHDKKLNTLSKGMQQRCTMAHALLGEPDIYIFDEPMSGLDPVGRQLFRKIFRMLAQQRKCVFFSTHILEDIELLCDHVIALSKGSLVFYGALRELIDQHTLGTELIVRQLSDDHLRHLRSQGFEVSEQAQSHYMIFVPSDKDVEACQRYLYTNAIFPKTIQSRKRSLESILYTPSQGGQRA